MKYILFILALLITFDIKAQGVLSGTRPGSIKPAWGSVQPAGLIQRTNARGTFSPVEVPNMQGWYDVTDASNVVVSGGNLVTNLKDKSGNGRDMNLNYNAVNYPMYVVSGGANNAAYMQVTNGTDLYTAPVSISQPYTIYYVMKNNTFTNTGFTFSGGGNVVFLGQTTQPVGNTLNVNAGSQFVRSANGYHTDWQVVTTVFNNNVSKFQINNEPFEISSLNYDPGTAGNTALSLIGFEPYYRNANYSVEELIIYSGVITGYNDSLVRRYLVEKYSPPLNDVLFGFGDSITFGAAATNVDTSSFMAYVVRDSGWQIVNNGYPGTAVLTGVGSAPPGHNLEDIYTYFQRYNDLSKTRILFAYGTNDAVTDATWVTRYKAVIQSFIDMGIPLNHLIVCTMPARAPGGVSGLVGNYITTYNNTVQVANDLGVILYDAITYSNGIYTSGWMSGDGIHPTDLGHREYANGLEQVLQ